MTTPTPSPVPFPIVDLGPETLFRVQVSANDATLDGSMPVGPWLDGPDGLPLGGSLGVLVDNVLGYAIIASRPPEHWSVSTEITLDVHGDLAATDRWHARARVVHADAIGGYATGEVLDDSGRLLATCSQRGRYVPAAAASLDASPPPQDLVLDAPDVAALLGVAPVAGEGGARLDLAVDRTSANPMRNLHGGVSLTVCDLAAAVALGASAGPPLRTASIHVVYTRAAPTGATARFTAALAHRGRSLGVVDVAGATGTRTCVSARVVAQVAGSPPD